MGRKKKKRSLHQQRKMEPADRDIRSRLPEAFLERMRGMLGDEYDAFINSYDRPRCQALRVNTLKCSVEDFLKAASGTFSLKPVPWCAEGFYYGADDRPGRHIWHEAGMYYIQEPSAMAVAALSGTKPGERVLDLCAAPGGKSTQLAAMLQGEGLLVSNEIRPSRARILSQNIERMGIRNAIVLNAAPEELVPLFPSFFDRIIVDAPCSGEGMFRKEEAAIPNWSPENVLFCAQRQAQILDCAAQMLSDGGTLVYSTCTFAPQEDEGTAAAFLARHPEFAPVDLPAQIGADKVREYGFSAGYVLKNGTEGGAGEIAKKVIRLWPHRLDGEGHFVAAFRREGERFPRGSGDAGEKNDTVSLETRLWENFAQDALADVPEDKPVLLGRRLYLVPPPMRTFFSGASKRNDLSGVLRPGLPLGEIRKDRFEPSHSLAMALKPGQSKRSCALTADDPRAAAFLRGESIPCDAEAEDGWTLVTVDGCSLGWGKCISGTLKNHYPKGLRKG